MTQANPCVGICKLHPKLKYCLGCYRSPLQIRQWLTGDPKIQEEIIASCELKREIYGEIAT